VAINTYATLKTSVASWVNRSDLTASIPDFVTLAEADIRRDVRVQAMESVATGTLTGETLAHPTRFIEARRLTLGGYAYEYRTPADYTELVRVSSQDTVYTSIGDAFYILNGKSGDSYSLTYWAAFAAFSADADTNWLLANAPDIYLFGALRYAAIFMADDAAMTRNLAMYLSAAKRVSSQEHRSAYSGSTITVRAR
jgi:hypothetical protein